MKLISSLCAGALMLGAGALSEANAAEARVEHAVYAEVLGKAGPWGLGYELSLSPRFAVGVAASYVILDDQRVTTVAPYLGAVLAGTGGRHRWFVQGGPEFVRVHTPSPVPEWDGATTSGIGVELSSGYEYRRGPFFLRGYAMVSAGRGGVAPWAGTTVGWAL